MSYSKDFPRPPDPNLFWLAYKQISIDSTAKDSITGFSTVTSLVLEAQETLTNHDIVIRDVHVRTWVEPQLFVDCAGISLGFDDQDDLAMARLLLGR